MEQLREIRDKISLETMDMSFEELQEYLAKRSKIHNPSVWGNKSQVKSSKLIAAEPRVEYKKK